MRKEKIKRKPVGLTEEHLTYLKILRESGVTNMFGASPYLARAFGLSPSHAREIVAYWMETFKR